MRTMVTGATGFVGRRVVPRLSADGHDVLALVRSEAEGERLKASGVAVVVGDLRRPSSYGAAVREFLPEACIHLAWQGIPDFSEAPSRLNLLASIDLFDMLARVDGCRKILVSGSCFEYGKTSGSCAEADQTQATSFFTWAKQSLYGYGSLLCARHQMDLLWLRMFYVYGPGQRTGSLVPSLVSSLRSGTDLQIKQPWNASDFVYVDDVASAFAMALVTPASSGIYNVGSGTATAVQAVSETAARVILGRHAAAAVPPAGSGGAINFWSDTSKTRAVLGWTATTDLDAGIRAYVASLGAA